MSKEIKKKRRNTRKTKTKQKPRGERPQIILKRKEVSKFTEKKERNTKRSKKPKQNQKETRVETTQKRTLESNNLLRTKCP
jgi:hypothetical protein